MSSSFSNLIQGLLQRLSPPLAELYSRLLLIRFCINLTIFLPVAFIAGVAIGWIGSTLVGVVVGILTPLQGKEHSVQDSPAIPDSQSASTPSAPSVPQQTQGKVVDCKVCNGAGTIEENGQTVLCSRCQGHGKLRIVPRGDTPVIGAKKSSSSDRWKLDNKSMKLLGILFGVLVIALGSRVPLVGNYIALAGVGMIVASLYVFADKKKAVATPNV